MAEEKAKRNRPLRNFEKDEVTEGYITKILSKTDETFTTLIKRLIIEEHARWFPSKSQKAPKKLP